MKKPLTSAAVLLMCLTSAAGAGQVIVHNKTTSPIKVFLRACEGTNQYQTARVSPNSTKTVSLEKGIIPKGACYDLIASKGVDSDIAPAWRLLAGECSNLSGDRTTHVDIEDVPGTAELATRCRTKK